MSSSSSSKALHELRSKLSLLPLPSLQFHEPAGATQASLAPTWNCLHQILSPYWVPWALSSLVVHSHHWSHPDLSQSSSEPHKLHIHHHQHLHRLFVFQDQKRIQLWVGSISTSRVDPTFHLSSPIRSSFPQNSWLWT